MEDPGAVRHSFQVHQYLQGTIQRLELLHQNKRGQYRDVQHIDRCETRMHTLTISLPNRDGLCYEKNDRRA